jgi:fermentation-respiration switch protein FrsA (DUF1100 family)
MSKALLIAVAIAAAILTLAYVLLRFLIYLPYGEVRSGSLPDGAQDVGFVTSDGLRLAGWSLPRPGPGSEPAVLVANGNAGNRGHRAPLAEALRAMGVSVLLFDYRGFGGNPGSPSERGLHRDALAARNYLAGRPEVDPDRTVYFGESIGAAVVAGLSLEHPPAGLVLRSPFTPLAEVGPLHYPWLPVRALLRDHYEVGIDGRPPRDSAPGHRRKRRLHRPGSSKPGGL